MSNSGYNVWLSEPRSVKERREMFLSGMGFVEPEPEIESCECLLSERRRSNSEANFSGWLGDVTNEVIVSAENSEVEEVDIGKSRVLGRESKSSVSWWRRFTKKMKRSRGANVSTGSELLIEGEKMKVERNQKRYMECTSLHFGQEIRAHNGLIWTMKFSPDGQYLASGGADGVVCIWRITSFPTDEKCYYNQTDSQGKQMKRTQASVLIPEKVFRIEDEPLHKFHCHEADVLDLAWSKTNHLLSSSMDKTVRLWQPGFDECLAVFQHNDYVTCVQFNPVDESSFVTGSIDGKVRIWGVERRRVKDWVDVGDIVTAVCYQPDGKGFALGSVSGNCRFYEIVSGDELVLNAVINIQCKKRSFGKRITGIQFLENHSQRVMITSEDSKIRILDGLEVVQMYKGLAKSGCQMSASLTSNGSHIVSVGEDSRVYLWNYEEDPSAVIRTATKHSKSTRSCESFFSDGVSVAVPWSDLNTRNNYCCDCRDESLSPGTLDSERFSLANWFSMDGSYRSSITWPEEKLPMWDLPAAGRNRCNNAGCGGESRVDSAAWGLVFVTGNRDGTIRTFHNFGLPVRL